MRQDRRAAFVALRPLEGVEPSIAVMLRYRPLSNHEGHNEPCKPIAERIRVVGVVDYGCAGLMDVSEPESEKFTGQDDGQVWNNGVSVPGRQHF